MKKYFVPIVAVVVLTSVFLLANKSKTEFDQKEGIANSKTNQASVKTESSETKEPVSNSEIVNSDTKNQSKVQSSTTQKQTNQTQSGGSTNEAGIPVDDEVTLKIEAGTKGNYSYQIAWESADTVWNVLQRASGLKSFQLEFDDKSYGAWGVYVKDIYDSNCECWTFKVNDTCSNKSASKFPLNEDDVILWSLNKICS